MAGSSPDLTVHSSFGDYGVHIGSGTLDEALAGEADVVVADRFFHGLLSSRTVDLPIVWVDAVEEHKTLAHVEQILLALRDAGVRRGSLLLAIGGGVVQDLCTLAASLYMRGLPWIYAPTTLMAMADSCIGGKSSINAGGVKNLVGNIYPPRRVVVDPVFLATLGAEEVAGGMAEAVKICFCRGADCFDDFMGHASDFEASGRAEGLLRHVLDAKRWFIEVDEFDQRERRLLNFGHTFGHATEAALGFRVQHGVGVAMGIRCAIAYADAAARRGALVLDAYCKGLLDRVPLLRSRLDEFDDDRFRAAFASDKKHRHGEFRLVLPKEGGGVEEVSRPATDDELQRILTLVRRVMEDVRR